MLLEVFLLLLRDHPFAHGVQLLYHLRCRHINWATTRGYFIKGRLETRRHDRTALRHLRIFLNPKSIHTT